jgi:hypothetical protein
VIVGGEEESLYVNAKQYERILKRRAARARLQALGQVAKARKVSSFSLSLSLSLLVTMSSIALGTDVSSDYLSGPAVPSRVQAQARYPSTARQGRTLPRKFFHLSTGST